MNPMKEIRIEKVTINIGTTVPKDEMEKGKAILKNITKTKNVETVAKIKQPKWDLRLGKPIGIKTTLRGKKAEEFLKQALQAKDNILKKKNFDYFGNFGFGIHEHIDLAEQKYDPNLGITGFDVLITVERPGYRVKKRKLKKAKIGKKHVITREEAIEFVEKKFEVKIE